MTNKTTEQVLLQFYKEWLEHATSANADEDKHPVFSNRAGLCFNLRRWQEANASLRICPCTKLMKEQLKKTTALGSIYPFGESAYEKHLLTSSQHKDPNRLRWVKNRIKEMEGVNDNE